MGEILRNKGKYERLGKPLQERARLNAISWDFSRGEISLGVLKMPCTSQKAAARTTQLAQRQEKNSKIQKPIKTECLPFPTHSHHFLTGHEGNMGEIDRNREKYEKIGNMQDTFNDEDNYSTPFCGNSQAEKVL